jgi:Domain of unknown function (DUF4202)
MNDSKLSGALAGIDAANAADPTMETVDGERRPAALVYSERMTRWLERIAPAASAELQIAVRAQHIERWTMPRQGYPMDREGYLRWRSDLAKYHAERAGEIMAAAGFGEDAVKRVATLIRKRGIKRDPEVQTLEDVACLVFLENYFADFSAQHDDEKVVSIVAKTWVKMSEAGHEAALTIDIPDRAKALVERALADG